MKKARLLLFLICLASSFISSAATVDSLAIRSAVMNKSFKAAVVLPASYKKSKASYPVLYLLHGGGGNFRGWLTALPDKMLVKNLADQYNLIVVMPEGNVSSWYLNSPLQSDSQFETYLTAEVIAAIDNTYRTVRDKKGRVITGLSMGGHGALYLATRHPDLYSAAGSMSGALDLKMINWRIPAQVPKAFAKRVSADFERLLGKDTLTTQYAENSVVNMADKMKANALPLLFDVGVDDFLVETNRELHRRLVYNHTPHDYTERPGGHNWEYWQNSLPYHLLFFHGILKANGAAVLSTQP